VTYSEFLAECNARTIFKSVAIENDKIRAALAARDDEEVKRLLDTDF